MYKAAIVDTKGIINQRELFLDITSEGHDFSRRIIEKNVVEVETGKYNRNDQSAGWYSIHLVDRHIEAKARIRGQGTREFSWEVPE